MVTGKSQPIIVIKRKKRPRWPSWRRMEGSVCRLCHRHDVSVHRAVADGLKRQGEEGGGGLLQRPQGDRQPAGHHMSGTGEAVTVGTGDNMQKLKEKLEQEIKAKKRPGAAFQAD